MSTITDAPLSVTMHEIRNGAESSRDAQLTEAMTIVRRLARNDNMDSEGMREIIESAQALVGRVAVNAYNID